MDDYSSGPAPLPVIEKDPAFQTLAPRDRRLFVADWARSLPEFKGLPATDQQKFINDAQSRYPDSTTAGSNPVADTVRAFKDTPYVWGGSAGTKGTDCSGMACDVLKKFGINLPRTAQEQFMSKLAQDVAPDPQAMKPGDAIYFKDTGGRTGITHVGVYLGDGKYGQMSGKKAGYREGEVGDKLWSNNLAGVKRFIKPPQYDAINQDMQSRPTQFPDPNAPTPEAVDKFRMDYFNTDNPQRYSAPMKVAVALAKNPKDPAARELLNQMQPVSQKAIMQKAEELQRQAEQDANTTIIPGQYSESGTTPPVAMDKRTGQPVITRPSEVIASAVRGPEGARQLHQAKGFGANLERTAYSLADPEQMALAIAAPVAGKVGAGLFAGLAGKQAIDKVQQGDYGGAAFDALLGVAAGAHAVKGAGETIGAVRRAGDISTPQLFSREEVVSALRTTKQRIPTELSKASAVPEQFTAAGRVFELAKDETGNPVKGANGKPSYRLVQPELEARTAVPDQTSEIPTGATPAPPAELPGPTSPGIASETVSGTVSEVPPIERRPTPKTTGPANVITEAERTARGLEPVTKQDYTLVNQAYEIGRKAVDEGRIDARTVAEEVASKPRPLNAEEVGALAYDRSQLINSHNAAMKAADAAVEAGDMRKAQSERVRINSIESLLDLNDQALAKGGREQSAAFSARKMLVAEDYSYAGMLQRAKTAKGEKLTETQRGQVQVLQHTINGLTEAVAKHQQRIAELESQRSIRKAAREDAFAVRTTGRKMTRQSLDTEYAQLKDAFVKAGSKLSAGLDPETAVIVGKMAVNRLKATGVKISDVVDHIFTDLKAHIPDLRRDDIRDAFNQAQSVPLEAQRQRTTESAAEYRRRLDTGEVVPPQRRNTLPYDRELEQLKMDQERAKRAYQQMVQNIGRTPGQRIARSTGEVFDAGRSVITSVDLSAPGRQGFFLAAARPVTAAKSIVPMLKAAVSEHGARQVDIEIHSRPNAPNYADSGLYISPVEHTGKLSALEEAYRSNLAERIPGIGPLVRGSERAYVTFLNKLRADNFDLLHKQVERMGEKDMAEADRAIANFINKATGRGSLGETGDRAATLLNRIFFSPRFVASRFQLLAGSPLYGGTAASRVAIAQTYLQYAGAISGILYLSYLAGAKVETNYHSPDFLKIRFGKQALVDVHAGLQQTARFLANMYSGDQNRGAVAARFARSKTSPLAGTVIDVVSGKDFIGQKVNTPKEVVQNLRRGRVKPKDYMESEPARNLVPMSIKDINEAAQKENVPTATALAMLAILGVGVAEYPRKNVSTHSRSAYAR